MKKEPATKGEGEQENLMISNIDSLVYSRDEIAEIIHQEHIWFQNTSDLLSKSAKKSRND